MRPRGGRDSGTGPAFNEIVCKTDRLSKGEEPTYTAFAVAFRHIPDVLLVRFSQERRLLAIGELLFSVVANILATL